MRIEENYIYFNKGDNKIVVNDKKITIPTYINNARSRYRFNTTNNVIEKQCSKCLTFYDVLKSTDNEFTDIHKEEEIHLHSQKSGFASACNKCKGQVRPSTPKKDTYPTSEESLNLNIPLSLKRTYQHAAIDHNCTLKDLVIKALEEYKKFL